MTHKDIKNTVRKQLKKEYPNWKRLKKKEKKAIAQQVLTEIVNDYDYSLPVSTPFPELPGSEGTHSLYDNALRKKYKLIYEGCQKNIEFNTD